MRLHQRHWQKSVIFVVVRGSESAFSSALERSERQGEDDSVVVLKGVQPIRQADWQCSLVVKQRSLTHEHTLQIRDKTATENNDVWLNMMRDPLHFCVFMCVYLAPRLNKTLHVGTRLPYTCCGGSIINSHRNPCVSRPVGVEEGGLAGAASIWPGHSSELTLHLVHLAGQLHVCSQSLFRDIPHLKS